ncbi:MAG TPA: CorA family divalent cation transporter, partial [Geodermatophilus sp.]|nr:CorA family divalent cation transporter [Geodermatophilus sp.]
MPGTEVPHELPTELPSTRPRPEGRPRTTPSRPDDVGPVVDCAIYVDGRREPPVAPHEALRAAVAKGGFVWLGLYAPTEDELGDIAEHYRLHPLAVEDAVYAHQRPKLERYDDG